jgi:hypothetical protein
MDRDGFLAHPLAPVRSQYGPHEPTHVNITP